MFSFVRKKHKKQFESDNSNAMIILFVIICIIVACTKENELWKKYAKECILAEKALYSHSIIDKAAAIIMNYDKDAAVMKLERTSPPTENELLSLLESNDPNDKKIALVTIDVKHIYSKQLYDVIINYLQPNQELWMRIYAYRCFRNLDDSRLGIYADKLLDAAENEKSPVIIARATDIFERLKSPRVVTLYVNYLADGSTRVKRFAYISLKYHMDEKFVEQVEKGLADKGKNLNDIHKEITTPD